MSAGQMSSAEMGFRLGALIGVCAGFVGAILMAFAFRAYLADQHALEETRLALLNLSKPEAALAPQLREYLKARVYANAARWATAGSLAGVKIDFGPVNMDILDGVSIDKDSPAWMFYEDAMLVHGVRK